VGGGEWSTQLDTRVRGGGGHQEGKVKKMIGGLRGFTHREGSKSKITAARKKAEQVTEKTALRFHFLRKKKREKRTRRRQSLGTNKKGEEGCVSEMAKAGDNCCGFITKKKEGGEGAEGETSEEMSSEDVTNKILASSPGTPGGEIRKREGGVLKRTPASPRSLSPEKRQGAQTTPTYITEPAPRRK